MSTDRSDNVCVTTIMNGRKEAAVFYGRRNNVCLNMRIGEINEAEIVVEGNNNWVSIANLRATNHTCVKNKEEIVCMHLRG